MWNIEGTDEFTAWFKNLPDSEQDAVVRSVELLGKIGPSLGRPHVDTLKGVRHANLKELRVQHAGQPYRVFFAFDPRRTAILLLGGNKAGDRRFYRRMIPLAEQFYDEYLDELRKEGLI
jgi:hypothetical protein